MKKWNFSIAFRYLLIALLSLYSLSTPGQKKEPRFFIGINAGVSGEFDLEKEQSQNNNGPEEGIVWVPGLQFFIDLPINKRIGVVTGLEIEETGFQLTWYPEDFRIADSFSPDGSIPTDPLVSRYSQGFASIPVLFRWSVISKRYASLELRTGIKSQISVYYRNHGFLDTDTGKEEWFRNQDWDLADPIRLAGSISILYCFDIGRNSDLQLYLAPQFDMMLTSWPEYWPGTYPYRAAVGVGIVW